MATKQELQKQIADAEAKGVEGQKLIEQGRQIQHEATASANELRAQLNQLEAGEQKASNGQE